MKDSRLSKKNIPFEAKEEKAIEDKERELIKFLEMISEKLTGLGIPLTGDCRIDIKGFGNVYSTEEIIQDQEEVERLEKEFAKSEELKKETIKFKTNPEKFLALKDQGKAGEKLELLKTAIFSKFLNENFIVVRTSKYDDIKNNVDNLIMEKDTGSLICALDEVGSTSGSLFEEKKNKVLMKNTQEGGKLKYGLQLTKGEIKLGPIMNVPIFLIALPTRHINEGIRNFNLSFDKFSNYEKKLFKFWILSLKSQIAALRLEKKINPLIKERLGQFETILENLDLTIE
jgi:uncharacterized protein related to proFAR isomerase